MPRPPLPPDPEPDELPLKGELDWPRYLIPDLTFAIETSLDLQTWEEAQLDGINKADGGKVTFDLPSGQGRAFYRLKIAAPF